MEKQSLNELEIASKSVVKDSARQFSKALAESPQFQEFESAYQAFNQDNEAQSTYRSLIDKQRSFRMLGSNAVDEKSLEDLKRIEEIFYDMESVKQYIKAQETLVSLCQEIGDILNEATGLNFGLASKVGGCCG